MNIEKKIEYFKKLRLFSIVATPRSGSDYFQSLIDGHPQVMSFNGSFGAYVGLYPEIDFNNHDKKNILQAIKKFIKIYKCKLQTKNDKDEGKNQLGKNKNECININLKKFKFSILKYIEIEGFTKKNFTLAIYFSYNFCLNLNFTNKKVLLMHPHNIDELKLFYKDFPESKYIFTIRDQRAGYFSTIYHLVKTQYNLWFNLKHHFTTLYRCLVHSEYGKELKLKYYCIRLEDLPHQKTLKKISSLLKIKFDKCLLKSTFAGKVWWGDNKQIKTYYDKWEKNRTYNNWRERLKKRDQLILNLLFFPILKKYGYDVVKLKYYDYVKTFILIIFPMGFEKEVIKDNLNSIFYERNFRSIKFFFTNTYYYIRRIVLCQKYFFLNFFLRNNTKNNFLKVIIN